MENSRQPPKVDVGTFEKSSFVRQSSLLPGEVRTPTMIVTLSDAWGDVNGDWAAPGSSVWDEDAPSRHSAQTPRTGYGREGDVWASATGSPLLGEEDDDGAEVVNAFAAAAAAAGAQADDPHSSPLPSAAELAAAALQALVPSHTDPQGFQGPTIAPPTLPPNSSSVLPQQQPQVQAQSQQREVPLSQSQPYHRQPRYVPEAHYNYENRFGAVHAAATSDPTRGMQGVVPAHTSPQQHQQPTNYYTVQEGGGRAGMNTRGRGGRAVPFNSSTTGRSDGIPILAKDENQHVGGGGGLFSGPGNGGIPFVPRLDDEGVANSIIASAGLPLSLHSLVDYIRGGQPQPALRVSALGSTQNALRNYPNLNEPPTEEDTYSNANNAGGVRGGGRLPQPSYTQSQQPPQTQQGRWNQSNPPVTAENTGFAVRGSDYNGGGGADSQHMPSPPVAYHSNNNNVGGGFVVSAGHAPTANSHIGYGAILNNSNHGGGGGMMAGRHKSESEYLSDLLHFHANFFPPPPPPRVPKEERRNRAELWYHYASKWDITHRLPPPPRTPLPEMELEYRMRLQRMTRVPYHGDGWLQMSERWFDVTQTLFDFPEENVGEEVDFNVVLQQAVLS